MFNNNTHKSDFSTTKKIITAISISSFVLGLSACSTNDLASNRTFDSEDLITKSEQLTAREVELAKREAEVRDRENALGFSKSPLTYSSLDNNDLLPPNASPGQCYARVWVEPTYKTREEKIVVSAASEKISIIPASYESAIETVLKKPETTKFVTIPPIYETITKQKLVKAGGMSWNTALRNGAPVDQSVLSSAEKSGIDLALSEPGTCYHEHFKAAQFITETENVLIKEEAENIEPIEAKYQWVEKEVVVSEASTKLEHIPASYKTVTEKVIDKPAHTVWKKGSGPIQKMDEATGEIMCLIDVPASYKNISKQVLVNEATTHSVSVPAQYKKIKVRELISDSSEKRSVIPAEYKQVSVTKKSSDPTFVWHEVHDNTMNKASRTGRQVCLVEHKPIYQAVEKRIVKTPAIVQKQIIPAEYETVTVQKLVRDAQEVKTVIPASYKTVPVREVATEGKMEWRSILCETNMTRGRISDVQKALVKAGYNPGGIDGVIGQQTMSAVNQYQRDNNLPIDKYLNIETLKALNVSAI